MNEENISQEFSLKNIDQKLKTLKSRIFFKKH